MCARVYVYMALYIVCIVANIRLSMLRRVEQLQ